MTTTAETEVKQTIAVTGIFENPDAVERAYEVAVAHGYEIGDVNVVMSEETRHRYYSQPGEINTEIAKKSAEGGELGGPTGGRIAIALSIAAAVGAAIAVPGLGFVMAGPIAVAAASAGAAGIAAGLIGAIAHWGLPERRMREYEDEINAGRILIGVQTRSVDDARSIAGAWRELGGRHIHG